MNKKNDKVENKMRELNLNVFKATRSSNGEIPKEIDRSRISNIYTIKEFVHGGFDLKI